MNEPLEREARVADRRAERRTGRWYIAAAAAVLAGALASIAMPHRAPERSGSRLRSSVVAEAGCRPPARGDSTGSRTEGPHPTDARTTVSGPVASLLVDVPLPGGASRFDYQDLDPAARRLYVAHMGAGELVAFDVESNRVLDSLPGLPLVTGVIAVPELGRVYASAAGAHEVVVIDAAKLDVRARLSGARFPDGLAYAPNRQKVYVSDETGRAVLVIDARDERVVATVPLGGEAGNTRYDAGSGCVLVAVQTRNQLAVIDPATDRVVGRYDLAGADRPHGLYVDAPGRLAFVACEGNARLLVVDLRTMRVEAQHPVGRDPDVLAFDPAWQRLYVASESGVVAVFDQRAGALTRVGEIRAPHAHSVAVDPVTHRIYLPLESVGGRPVLRVLDGVSPEVP